MDERPDETAPRWLRWALRVAVVLPMVVAASRAVATGWFPVGDSALLSIRAYDVGTEHHPLLGSWTSASLTLGTDVNNPGPLYADLLAPFMWAFGRWFGIGTAVAIGVATVNAGFALFGAWIGNRLGGWRVERWVLLMVAALGWAMGSELLIDIWQPHALLLPFACLLLLTVGLVDRRWSMLPWWLGAASLIVQTHIGYVYVVVVLAIVIGVHAVIALRGRPLQVGQLIRSRTSLISLAVIAVAWVQPVIEQLFGEGRGNLARLAANAGGGPTTIGGPTAVKLTAQVVAIPPWWMRFGFDDAIRSTPLTDTPDGSVLSVPGLAPGPVAALLVVVVTGLLIALTVLARQRGLTLVAGATTVAAVGVVTAVVTLAIQTVSVVGLGAHHVRWLFVLALFVHVTIAWAVVELGWLDRLRQAGPVLLPMAIGVFVAANLPMHAHDLGPTADRAAADTLERTFDDLDGFDPGGPVRYDVSNLRPFEPWSSAVQMRLRELGIEFKVADEGVVRQLGNRRRAEGSEVTTIRQIERGAALIIDGCVISSASPLDEATEKRVDALIDAAVADVVGGEVDVDTSGLRDDLPARFAGAKAGDVNEARILVSDGLFSFFASDGRLVTSTPAVDAIVDQAVLVDRRVVGTLVLVTDPPTDCS